MLSRTGFAGLLALMLSLLAVGCGDSNDESGSSASQAATATESATAPQAEAEGGGGEDPKEAQAEERSKTACKAAAAADKTGLPAAFPLPGELTVTEVRKDGPTVVVDGYWTSGLDEAYAAWEEAVGAAGYTVLKKEKEERDAEIAYQGSRRTGQIALRDNCTERDTTRVHITNRPA